LNGFSIDIRNLANLFFFFFFSINNYCKLHLRQKNASDIALIRWRILLCRLFCTRLALLWVL